MSIQTEYMQVNVIRLQKAWSQWDDDTSTCATWHKETGLHPAAQRFSSDLETVPPLSSLLHNQDTLAIYLVASHYIYIFINV